MNKMKKGFTLVEIMIVVAIIAILAAIAIPNFIKYRTESQENACESSRASIITAAENWGSKTANAAATTVTLETLCDSGKGYFKTAPKCPAGGTFTISKDGTTKAWTCTCSEHSASSSSSSSTEVTQPSGV